MSETDHVVDEGDGFFRVPCPGHPKGDVVVQPRPVGRFVVFREHQVEPKRWMFDDAESAVGKAREVAGAES